jgi:hypothetical protein
MNYDLDESPLLAQKARFPLDLSRLRQAFVIPLTLIQAFLEPIGLASGVSTEMYRGIPC